MAVNDSEIEKLKMDSNTINDLQGRSKNSEKIKQVL